MQLQILLKDNSQKQNELVKRIYELAEYYVTESLVTTKRGSQFSQAEHLLLVEFAQDITLQELHQIFDTIFDEFQAEVKEMGMAIPKQHKTQILN